MAVTLHHIAFQSPAPDEAVSFYVTAWGLRETGRDETGVRLGSGLDAGTDYSLVIKPSVRKSVDHFCLVADDESLVDELREKVARSGVTVLDNAPACPEITKGFYIADIDGRRVEIGYRPGGSSRSSDGGAPDSVPLFPAHIVLNTPDIDAATDWYQEKLGFGLRDWRAHQMSFLYYNSDHHTIAFNAAPHVSLNHVAWELGDINQFFRAVGRATDAGLGERLYGPGRHGPGDYIFCYFLDPSGFIAELETDGLKIARPEDYPFRVHEWSPESADQWLGTLSGGLPQRFRDCATGEPDQGLVSSASV